VQEQFVEMWTKPFAAVRHVTLWQNVQGLTWD
jgi:hypothetical protein